MTRYHVAGTEAFERDGDRVNVDVRGRDVTVFRYDGDYHAMLNYCVHQGGPLCEGSLTGRNTLGEDGWEWVYEADRKYVNCPWHGWRFDVTTGRSPDDERYAVPTFDVTVEDDEVYVEL